MVRRFMMFSAILSLLFTGTSAAAPDDPLYPLQWALQPGQGIQVNETWPETAAIAPVVVALIDTGVDLDHPDLTGSFWTNPGEIPGNGIDDDGNGYIDDVHAWNFIDNTPLLYGGPQDLHGTHTAGTIAADTSNGIGISGISGTGGAVQLMVLKVLDGAAGGPTAGVLDAIAYARDNGAKIVNLSLTSLPADDRLYRAVRDSEMLFVVSAGNQHTNLDTALPRLASYSLNNLVSVANLQPDGTIAANSNYGPTSVDLAAPGTQILSTAPGGTYDVLTGTSMAAPMVTAAAALLLAQAPDLTPPELRELLLRSADKTPQVQNLVYGGSLNLAAALQLMNQMPGE